MSHWLDVSVRFSDVVHAIGATPRAVRKWLERDQVSLMAQREAGWHKFSLVDVMRLALIRRLVDFGVDVASADTIVTIHYAQLIWTVIQRRDVTIRALFRFLAKRKLIVWKKQGKWISNEIDNYEYIKIDDVDAYIVIEVDIVIHRALSIIVKKYPQDPKLSEDSKTRHLRKA